MEAPVRKAVSRRTWRFSPPFKTSSSSRTVYRPISSAGCTMVERVGEV